MQIKTFDEIVDPARYGFKAYWISWLRRHNYNVPYAVFIPHFEEKKELEEHFDEIKLLLQPMYIGSGLYKVAIRSSATCEDLYDRSYAGHFKTFLGIMNLDEITEKIEEVRRSLTFVSDKKCNMGVIIQQLVDPDFSGVIFSSDPIYGDKRKLIMSVVRGRGDKLVAGLEPGEDIYIEIDERNIYNFPNFMLNLPKEHFKSIAKTAKEIENELNFPVDVEWALASKKTYYLQCRPITGFQRYKSFLRITKENLNKIPDIVKRSEKVFLRILADKLGIEMSKGYLVAFNTLHGKVNLPKIIGIIAEKGRALSLVLLYPSVLGGKVIRYFVKSTKKYLIRCARSDVRWFINADTLKYLIEKIGSKVGERYWYGIVIIQEIISPIYTGIIRKVKDGFIIEVAKGHFIPKGIVPTTRYITDFCGNVIHESVTMQKKYFDIVEEQHREIELAKPEKVELDMFVIKTIIKVFQPIFQEYNKASIEFGLRNDEASKTLKPYLIDIIFEKTDTEIASNHVAQGIISPGIIKGKIQYLSLKEKEAFDYHFYDKTTSKNYDKIEEPIIYFAERPALSLLEVVNAARSHNRNIGFIFKEGSVLCHLAILLRESGIPALILPSSYKLHEGEYVVLDTATHNIPISKRIRRLKTFG